MPNKYRIVDHQPVTVKPEPIGGQGGLSSALRPLEVLHGFPTPEEISTEVAYMFKVLTGEISPPIDIGVTTLMEVADAFYARAYELTSYIHRAERRGETPTGRGSGGEYYTIRTGELADFLEACKRSVETGSRRLSAEQLRFNQHERGLSIDSEALS